MASVTAMQVDRLDAIFAQLAQIEKNSATAHAQIQGTLDRMSDRIDVLAERQAVANGRTSKLEASVGELQMQARIADSHAQETEESKDKVSQRVWGFVTGSGLVILGAIIGHFI